MKVKLLRLVHGVFVLYFLACLVYIYYGALTSTFDGFLLLAIISLAIEGFIVFVLNGGDCPLIHVQKRIGDDTPFFDLFLPTRIAKKAIPLFAAITWAGVFLLVISYSISIL